jgi:small subunit ribosomal protein S24e
MKWGERERSKENGANFEKHFITFVEKIRNVSVASASAKAQTFLRNTTRLDIITYVLFGAYRIKEVERGLECDEWLPVQGRPTQLNQLRGLKVAIEACVLRGIAAANTERREARLRRYASARPGQANAIDDRNDDDDERDDAGIDENRKEAEPLSREEIMELDFLTRDVVRVLEQYKEERIASQSRRGSRPATPYSVRASPSAGNIALPSVSESSFSSGIRQLLDFGRSGGSGDRSPFRSRPQTPLGEVHSRV